MAQELTLEQHVYNCWRLGYRVPKIIDTFHQSVSEGEVLEMFKFVLDTTFFGE
jgi:hypothetical protein